MSEAIQWLGLYLRKFARVLFRDVALGVVSECVEADACCEVSKGLAISPPELEEIKDRFQRLLQVLYQSI